jgi:3-hydroxy-5-methyl-1-naphthoate 3-O-methyltransferase
MAMIDFTTPPVADPTPLYERRDSIYADDLLTLAIIELDFFSWLSAHPGATAQDVAQTFSFQKRGTDVLLTLLQARQLIEATRTQDRGFTLTPMAAQFLTSDAGYSLRPYYAMLKDRPGVKDLLHVLRTNEPVFWGGKQTQKDDWHQAMLNPDYARSFTAAMDCRGIHLAQAMSRALPDVGFQAVSSVLDIAGGSGIYACSLAAHFPQMKAAVLELPPVDRVASQLIAERGMAGQVSVIAGDMMNEPLPGGFEAHLWSNVLHDWDVPEVLQLIQASAQALAPGAWLVIHDAFLNDDNSGPLHAAEYSVTLAYATRGRCYGTQEMSEWLTAAGFHSIDYRPTLAARGIMVARMG